MKTMTTLNATVEAPAVPKKIEERRPWYGSINHPVPWEMRTYALNVDTGRIEVMPDKFFPVRDPLKHNVLTATKGAIKKEEQNPQSYPVLEHGDVDRLYADAEKCGEPLKIVYARLFGLDALTGKQQARLAMAPDVYAAKTADLRKAEQTNASEKLKELQAAAAKSRPVMLEAVKK